MSVVLVVLGLAGGGAPAKAAVDEGGLAVEVEGGGGVA